MTDDKANKISGTTRLPDELLMLLRQEVAPYMLRGEKPPAFGDLLLNAWKVYKSAADIQSQTTPDTSLPSTQSDKIPANNSNSTNVTVIESKRERVEVTPGELGWLQSLLYLLRRADADTRESIQKNLATFERLTRAIIGELHGQPNKLPPAVSTDQQKRMERVRELGARHRGTGSAPRGDEKRLPGKKNDDSDKTGTGGKH